MFVSVGGGDFGGVRGGDLRLCRGASFWVESFRWLLGSGDQVRFDGVYGVLDLFVVIQLREVVFPNDCRLLEQKRSQDRSWQSVDKGACHLPAQLSSNCLL